MEIKFPDIEVQLSGEDGNAFSIIGRVSKAIRRAEGNEEADKFSHEAMTTHSYDELLQLVMRTVETR